RSIATIVREGGTMIGTAMPPAVLTRRSSPQQKRSLATMERILQAGAELLEEVGVEAFNTNLLSERAGVGVRAIYRYFPNKWAILVAMAEQVREAEREWIGDLKNVSEFIDWREAVDRAIDGYFASASRHKGYVALRIASQAAPQLRAFDDQANRELEIDLASGLESLGLRLGPEHLTALCRVIVQSSFRVLDVALLSPPAEAQAIVKELKVMIKTLLAVYLADKQR
ncbi:unnamed protein product, partial [marine sediment metagenome]